MSEPKKRRTRRITEIVDFSGNEDTRTWLQERAVANYRSLSQEIVYRLKQQKKNIEAGSKNLKNQASQASEYKRAQMKLEAWHNATKEGNTGA